ncbi:MAG: DNA adenine methylase, partial [Clostridia bacterium]|nr:DNA adenine methylase [Clostridia bacterium]
IYADPPYLITTASYNEKSGWTEDDEKNLLAFLDNLTERKIKFAMSNVLETDGKENKILKSWLDNKSNYKCNHLSFSYSNSNYHKKNTASKTDEVLITNY